MNDIQEATLNRLIDVYLGRAYLWGGSNALTGFDCSGLVIELLQSVGVLPPGFDATAQGLRVKFPAVIGQPLFGDLVFFGSKQDNATHVGFCLGGGLMVEAGGGGSRTRTREDAEKQNACIRIRPIANRKDVLDYARPNYWGEE